MSATPDPSKPYEVHLRVGTERETRVVYVESMRVALATVGALIRKLTPPDELAKDHLTREIIADLTAPDAEKTAHDRPFYVFACEGFVVMAKRPHAPADAKVALAGPNLSR
jgi:hypothetical protein